MDNFTITDNITKAINSEIKRLMAILKSGETNAPIALMKRIQDLITTRDTLHGIATWGFDYSKGE